MKLGEKLANLPREPGVYLMKDREGQILYIGKAKDLKARVGSYFRDAGHTNAKTAALVQAISDFDLIIVRSEVEALLLERSLIKHEKPPYNVLLRDDKEYPLLRIDLQQDWPRIQKVRRRKEDGALYLGPYGNASQLNLLLAATFKIFPLVRCSEYDFEHAKRPCNYYHMKQCLGPCTLPVDKQVYRHTVDDAIAFLQGHNLEVKKSLSAKMRQHAEALNFEMAALYRDQIEAMDQLKHEQIVVNQELEQADVIGLAEGDGHLSVHVLIIRDFKLLGNHHFAFAIPVQTAKEALLEFLLQYYDRREPPARILLPFSLPELDHLAVVFSEFKTSFLIPKQAKKKKLVDLASRNARYSLAEHLREKNRGETALRAVQAALRLPRLPRLIECIDISHTQGTATVGSLVCFEDGKPAKSRYRKYNLSDNADKPDDFASIATVLSRRLRRAQQEDDLPDLFVIDGGKGQLHAALQAADNFPELQVPIVALAKSRLDKLLTERHDQSIHSPERVFLPGESLPIELELGSSSYRLLTLLRDEAHRFAISHHRHRRSKIRQASLLEEVKGIGPKLRQLLYRTFHDLEGLKKASLEELKQVKGLRSEVAEDLYNKLHPL